MYVICKGKKGMNKSIVKLLAGIMSAALLAAIVTVPVSAKETAKSIKVSNVEGIVATQTGDLNIKFAEKDMKLDDAVRVVSSAQSYCWIKLDNYKNIKLDQFSDVTILKNGKNYDVYLNSGSVYFDITKKLAADESLRFHAEDTVTDIVGTIGYIQSDENKNINISILEGEANFRKGGFLSDVAIELYADGIDDKTGRPIDGEEFKLLSRPDLDAFITIITTIVPSGTSVSVSKTELSVSSVGQTASVTATKLSSSDIPGFAAIEVKNSAEAQRRILESGASLDVNQITNQALERLESDSRTASQKLETLQKQKEQERLNEQFINEKKFVESILADARAKEAEEQGSISIRSSEDDEPHEEQGPERPE